MGSAANEAVGWVGWVEKKSVCLSGLYSSLHKAVSQFIQKLVLKWSVNGGRA